ncbi:unnamed protein product [Soboliphyme baturini]|uniref:Ribosome-recycling factor, mitochondrial n=1 Tax=Soboliphyme baturini TaxID=241478 RepID=A0A183IUF0_9BILA|nr:unnamed protein product [Soboliphyme baturini]
MLRNLIATVQRQHAARVAHTHVLMVNGSVYRHYGKQRDKGDYRQQLSVRVGVKAFETLKVQLSETESVPLNHVANVSLKNPQLVIINLSSSPQLVKQAVNAIIASGLNVSPQQQGTVLYAPLPRPSREHRERLAKGAKLIFNQLQKNLRHIQHTHELRLRKLEGSVSKEIYNALLQELHDAAHSHVADAEKLMKSKQNELLQAND